MTDLSRLLEIPGRDADVDSFAACVTAVMRYWGHEFDYPFAAGLSGSVFSPVLNENETCAAWWTESGNDNRVELIGGTLGFNFRRSPEISPEERDSPDKPAPLVERFWNSAREAFRDDRMVIIGTWPTWSVVTGWSEDLYLPEVKSLPATQTLVKPRPTDRLYILVNAPAKTTRVEALRESLKFAADIADGTFSRPGFAYGGKLYDAFLARLGGERFCGTCGDKSHNCAGRTLEKIAGLARTAVDFLEFAGAFLGRQIPQPALSAVVRGYSEIAGTSSRWTDREKLGSRWGHPETMSRLKEDLITMREAHNRTAPLLRNLVDYLP